MEYKHLPEKQGLYDPQFEHDSCGVGFVCHIGGNKSHTVIEQGLEVLRRLSHRGATGADPKTGDGAGIIMQIPHDFFALACLKEKINLPGPRDYGTGLVFLPREKKEKDFCKTAFLKIIKQEKQELLGWRKVPVDISDIGITAKNTAPVIEQIFIAKNTLIREQIDFERKLYLIRKQVENIIRDAGDKEKDFYITNLSSRTFCYKGLLMPEQLENFFPDLKEKNLKSALCLVHSRYSTNTFPAWNLSQPFRFLAHNGEINTLRGNINWMRAREGLLKSGIFNKDMENIKPVIVPGGSDSAAIDNLFELLVLSGRSLPHAMMMLIPGAWENNLSIKEKIKAFYKYHACFMEPWDGPAAIAFTDGISVGAVLDRNGLRPARYFITRNNLTVMASEAGVLDIAPEDIVRSGRLEPGKMLYIDTGQGRIIQDEEIKEKISGQQPYSQWLKQKMINLEEIKEKKSGEEAIQDLNVLFKAFGYTREDLKVIISPMAEAAHEPTGSMGNDTPYALLSKRPALLYNYFKQLFAQVTNPAIDPIREEIVMSQQSFLGPEKSILEETPEHCQKLWVKNPILTNAELSKIKGIDINGFKTKVIPLLFSRKKESNLPDTLEKICNVAVSSIKEGYTFIVLSDRGVNKDSAAIPALLATGAVHQHLVKKALRTQIGIIVESAESREVHHFALLFGYGADCINPYLAYEAIDYLSKERELNIESELARKNYIHALEKGILKILSKMGISTLQSYRGAQIFEALGLSREVIDKSFCGTVSRIGGADFAVLAKEILERHDNAYLGAAFENNILESGGVYQWKRDGEFHLWNPESIAALQDAARKDDYNKYQEFAQLINNQALNPTTLRSLFKFKAVPPVSIEQVEPVSEIVRRFASGAMSFGSISKEAHETIAIAMNRLGGRSNTGEGGEDPARFTPLANGDSKRSAIKQVASGRFGVTTNYLVNADELQIKIAQGAKPGEGGQLPGHKVSAIIAKTRYTTAGVTLISPPPHHDIYSIEDLAQLIFDLKNVNPRARISVKLVSEAGVGTVAAGVAKGHADMILISGGDGGTGASPLSSIKHAGLPWELGLSETHQILVLNDLRSRVRLQTDGQMRTGRDVAIAALLGAEEYGFCSAVLIILGCVMLRHCHLNNCCVGVATQDDILRARFKGEPDFVINYFNFVAKELQEIMAQLGIRNINELVGRTDLLEINKDILPWKAANIDYSRILYKPQVAARVGLYCKISQDHKITKVLDRKLIDLAVSALDKGESIKASLEIKNTDRACGAMLSGELVRRRAEAGLADDIIWFKFKGVAGQSFGAWLSKGITFELEGMANDYVGKGISGGKIIIYPDKKSQYASSENIIIGNTAFYGAIRGEAYISGIAGERFCIRNSGLRAVVEGMGDHGLEYMTGGIVVVLGHTGRNFAAGMSGGVAYVYDADSNFKARCNLSMINLEKLEMGDKKNVRELLSRHYKHTESDLAKKILDDFERVSSKFIKVMPLEYKRILEDKKLEEQLDMVEVSDS